MNAVQFIQQHGIEKARKVIEDAPDWAMSINFNNGVYYSRMEHKKGDTFLYDIKRLVDSLDLVESYGGIINAKNELILLQKHLNKTFGYVTIITSEKIENLEQAIADYELIYSDKDTNYGEQK